MSHTSRALTTRRALLRGLASSALTLPLAGLVARSTEAAPVPAVAKRLFVFSFPDGVPEPSGGPGYWHPRLNGGRVELSTCLAPLAPHLAQCTFLRGLSMGPADAGSHPGGAKKLLSGVDGGAETIDRALARTVFAGRARPHLYLGAMATANNASGDRFVSALGPGQYEAPEDDPARAFASVFAGAGGTVSGGTGGTGSATLDRRSILDVLLADIQDLRARLGTTEQAKLEAHLEALREVEQRVQSASSGSGPAPAVACSAAPASLAAVNASRMTDPANFPAILRAQTDLAVQAAACGLTSCAVIQASQHTSELIMSRFANTPLFTPNSDMRSHQASHYGSPGDAKYAAYTAQRTWFVEQFAYLLEQLRQRPDGAGTMLDTSLVLLCTEVSDGNVHGHDDMPFVLAGGAGGAHRGGRILEAWNRRHSDLLFSVAKLCGSTFTGFGQACAGEVPGLRSA
jgi:hypothetical protein